MNTSLQRLDHLENIISQGLKTFVDVGHALAEIRESRLYRERYDTFEDYCRERWGIERRQAYRMMDAATVVSNVSHGTQAPINERQARPLTKFNGNPELQRDVWETAVNTAPNGRVTAKHVTNTIDEIMREMVPEKNSKPHVSNNSGNNEWYTPKEYIEAARGVMGSIDVDPASSPAANAVVKADFYYTKETNGLDADLFGNVWMNPPYAAGLIGLFCEKLVSELCEIDNAIVLVNNATETKWFQLLAEHASAICFPSSRVKFWNETGETGQPLQGQALLYIGSDTRLFRERFAQFGFICAL